jgi:hypothetical protein
MQELDKNMKPYKIRIKLKEDEKEDNLLMKFKCKGSVAKMFLEAHLKKISHKSLNKKLSKMINRNKIL